MRLIGRLFLLFAGCAVLAWGVWTFALGRPGMQRELFERAAEARYQAAQPRPVDAAAFRATACAATPCLLVETGGLALLVGAGAGTTEGLYSQGLLRADLDGVLLTSLQPRDFAGLAELVLALRAMGRVDPLQVSGPAGFERIVTGLNSALTRPASEVAPAAADVGEMSPDPAVMLVAGQVLASEGDRGDVVFDSGVVAIRRFPVSEGAQALFRIEFDGRVLIAGGCGAVSQDVLRAARGATQAAAILPASSDWMLAAQKLAADSAGLRRPQPDSHDPSTCLTPEEAVSAFREARLAAGMLAPLYPAPLDQATTRLWNELTPQPAGLALILGEPGAMLDVGDLKAQADVAL